MGSYHDYVTNNKRTGPQRKKATFKNKKLLLIGLTVVISIIIALGIVVFSGLATPGNQQTALPASIPPSASIQITPSPSATVAPSPSPSEESKFLASGVISGDLSYISTQLNIKIEKINENGITYFVVDLYCKDQTNMLTVFAKDKYGDHHEAVSSMAKRSNAILAINADYCGHRPTGVIIRNGKLYRDKPKEQIAAIFSDGTMRTYLASETNGKELLAAGAVQTFSFGPALLNKDGEAIPDFKGISSVRTYNPRTAIGQISPGHFIILVVNGRGRDDSKGMTMEDLAKEFDKRGCTVAYNLDGGGSTTLYFMGRVLNKPCYDEERRTSDAICFVENQ